MFCIPKYQENNYPLPDRDNLGYSTKHKRSADYCKRVAQHIYSSFIKGESLFTKESLKSVASLRDYAKGDQPQEKYKDVMLGRSSNNGVVGVGSNPLESRKAYANIDFSIMSPMPRIIDAVISKLKGSTDIVSVDAIDSASGAEKENLKWGAYVDGRFREMFESLRTLAGLPQQELGFVPKNVEELNLYDAEGGFKLDYCVAMEELLKYVMDESRWDEELITDILFDLIVNGFAVLKDEYDPITGKVKAVYCDPAESGVQYTRETQYNKPDWGFSTSMKKISDIRRKFPKMEEKELYGLAEKYTGKFGNPSDLENWNNVKLSNNGYSYDDSKVPVLECAWIDVEYSHEIEHINKAGKIRTFPYEGQRLGKKDKKVSTRVKMLYECSWIIDTEYVYDYGVARFQARDGLSDPVIPYHAVKVKGRPIVPRVIPALDMFQNSWLKLQHGISMAALDGFSVNLDAINNMNLGGGKLPPLEVIKIWRQTGILFRKDSNTVNLSPSSGRAIEPVMGGSGRMITDALQGIEVASRMIEETTGINPITLGSQPQSGQGKGVTEFSIEGTNNVLAGIISRANVLKSDIARNMCLRLQLVVNTDKIAHDKYKNVIGETRLELLKIAEGHDVRYGIRTQVRPTEAEIQEIFEMINLSLKNGRDGKVGITEADAIRFKSMIHSGSSLKRVAQLLDFAAHKAQEERTQREQQNQELNAQLNQQTEQAKAKLRIEEEQMRKAMEQEVARQKAIGDVLIKAYEKGEKPLEYVLNMLGVATPEQQIQQQQMAQQQQMQGQGANPATDPAQTVEATEQGMPSNIPSN